MKNLDRFLMISRHLRASPHCKELVCQRFEKRLSTNPFSTFFSLLRILTVKLEAQKPHYFEDVPP